MKFFSIITVLMISSSIFAQSEKSNCGKMAQAAAESVAKVATPSVKYDFKKTKTTLLQSVHNDVDFSVERTFDVNVGKDAEGIVYKVIIIEEGKSCQFVSAYRGFGNG